MPPLLPMKPKTRMKIKGNTKLKTTAEGLRKIARRLAFVIASMAVTWLYFFMQSNLGCKAIGYKGFGKIWKLCDKCRTLWRQMS